MGTLSLCGHNEETKGWYTLLCQGQGGVCVHVCHKKLHFVRSVQPLLAKGANDWPNPCQLGSSCHEKQSIIRVMHYSAPHDTSSLQHAQPGPVNLDLAMYCLRRWVYTCLRLASKFADKQRQTAALPLWGLCAVGKASGEVRRGQASPGQFAFGGSGGCRGPQAPLAP